MMLSATIPLLLPTFDGRRIVALGIMRSFPMPLLATPEASPGHFGAVEVGQIAGVTFIANVLTCSVLLTCRLHTDVAAEVYRGWYLGPDIAESKVIETDGILNMTGNLMGATLDPRPVWPDQEPVTLHEEFPL